MTDTAEIETAPLKLERGGVYVIEVQSLLSLREIECLRKILSEQGERLGVEFVLLSHGLRIARDREPKE